MRSDFTRARLVDVIGTGADFTRARPDGVIWTGTRLDGATFEESAHPG